MAWYRAKHELNSYKNTLTLKLTLTMDDIMPLVNKAWNASFAHKELAKQAVAMQGWNPLNRSILMHPEVVKTKVK